jgi:hypothetical protein
MNTHNRINPSELHATIKLGIDAHAKWFYVGRQLDGPTLPNGARVRDAITRKNKQSFNETVSLPLGSNPHLNSIRGLFLSFPLFFTLLRPFESHCRA